MKINNDEIMKCVEAIEHMYNISKSSEEIDESKLQHLIKVAIEISNYKFNGIEKNKIKDEAEYLCQTKHTEGVSITNDYNHYDWYTERLKEAGAIEPFFWDRYRKYLLEDQHLGLNVVNKLDKTTLIELMNYLGDPKSDGDFLRRGLIIGDVQSGKTSTYIGLTCKAADAGYKVIILLTGTIETLRNQTQKRVEEGFVGFDISQFASGAHASRVGVGKDGKPLYVTAMTSRDNDFVGNTNKITTSLESNKVVLCVIKKNTKVLEKLYNWLYSLNADITTGKIPYPMLLIDDEADNASINTNKPEEDPTKINEWIRSLIDVFTQSTYIGFTATPFANVFINPNTDEEMENHDLFPEDFVYCLPTPSKYIGAQKIFFEDGKYKSALKFVKDAGEKEKDGYSFYYTHKKDWKGELPKSLTDAIYTFMLANAIRDLRYDYDEPRTMMINISRFVDVQYYVKEAVEQIYEEAYNKIKFDLSSNFDKSINIPIIKKIYDLWEKNYSELKFSWEQISNILYKSIENIQIKVVNSSKGSDKLDYEHNPNLRVIAIGGLALSRGLTLEGLVISYFYRNTCTYDVLMQMGRWFGYRKNYDDVFRIWTSKKSVKWYAEISYATELLKEDLNRMREYKRTPKEFGIRVRNDSSELRITAANKMRMASDNTEYLSYFGDVFETPYLINDTSINEINLQLVNSLVRDAITVGIEFAKLNYQGKHYALRNVPKKLIISFINNFKSSKYNRRFDTKQIYEFLISCSIEELNNWDIVFMEGTKKKDQIPYKIEGKEIYRVKRNSCLVDEYQGRINIGNRGKLAGTSDGRQCLDDQEDKEIISHAEECYRKYYKENKKVDFKESSTYPINTWFKYIDKRNPLLLVYLMELEEEINDSQVNGKIIGRNDEPWVGLAMGIPNCGGSNSEMHKYKVNPIYTKQEVEEFILEGEEE